MFTEGWCVFKIRNSVSVGIMRGSFTGHMAFTDSDWHFPLCWKANLAQFVANMTIGCANVCLKCSSVGVKHSSLYETASVLGQSAVLKWSV